MYGISIIFNLLENLFRWSGFGSPKFSKVLLASILTTNLRRLPPYFNIVGSLEARNDLWMKELRVDRTSGSESKS